MFIIYILSLLTLLINGVSAGEVSERKLQLEKKATELEARLNAVIKKLEAENRLIESFMLKAQVKILEDISTRLKNVNLLPTVVVLETELNLFQTQVEKELKLLEIKSTASSTEAPTTAAATAKPTRPSSTAATKEAESTTVADTAAAPVFKRDAKSDAVAKAEALEKTTNAEIKKLTAAGNKAEADVLTKEEKELQTLATILKAATDVAEITRLETQLKAIETRINAELKRAEGKTSGTGATTKAAESTTVSATTATTTATITSKPLTTLTIVTASISHTTITTHKPVVIQDLRDELLIRISELQTISKDEIKKLTDEEKNSLAIELLQELSKLHELATDLKAATLEVDILRLEIEVVKSDSRITHILKNINTDI